MTNCAITQEEVLYLFGHICAIYTIVMNVIVIIIHLACKRKRRYGRNEGRKCPKYKEEK